jgi:hypothetical protein
MIIFLLIASLSISVGILVISYIIIKRILVKIDTYEKYILHVQTHIENTLEKMREIDSRGTFATRVNDSGKFECDDEVGVIFKDLVELLEELRDFVEGRGG